MKKALGVLLVLAPLVMTAVHALEDRYDLPGVHDCWGIRTHKSECGGSP